ncbi:MAG: hypothetical protein NZM43_12170 [Saprospiraceae bacterium]|nr:hypothetical protein [Saprospiraceae bacterium]MDW8485067.1 hypothetical protein [Saprospiraceae bacterium]
MSATADVVFLTRHYPPNPNINGEAVCDLVAYLEQEHGIRSKVLCMGRSFAGGGGQRQPAGEVLRLWTPYEGNRVVPRLLTMVYDGLALVAYAWRYRNSWIVCTTSPPLLPLWVSWLLPRQTRWLLWAFDLFPEGFSATGWIKERHLLYRLTRWATYLHPPKGLIALGPRQGEHLRLAYRKPDLPTWLLPCGVFFHKPERPKTPPAWHDPQKITLGYCGNVGDPHNPEFIRAAIDHIDPKRHQLILALYGNQATGLKRYAQGKAGIALLDHVPREQLAFIDVHLVSLRRSWTHIAVPSKAVSAVAGGSAILFCGSPESDNWHLLQEAGWLIEENESIQQQVALFLEQLTLEELRRKQAAAPNIYQHLQQMVRQTYEQLGQMFQYKGR